MRPPACWRLAQINVARALRPLDHPEMVGFVDQLDRINALAEQAPGFVWRLQDQTGNAAGLQPFDDPRLIVNLSLWRSVDALFDFTYRTGHTLVMRQKKSWFERPAQAHMALWWLRAGELPTVEDGASRLDHLRQQGPGPTAFTLEQRFPAPTGATAAGAAA
jgi:hypothetical protein